MGRAMSSHLKEPDDSLDFTVILTNPSQATTQSWAVAEVLDPHCFHAAPPATPGLNDHFLIGGKADPAHDAVARIRRRRELVPPLPGAPVLVVDDDLVTRKVLEKLLLIVGYPVEIAGNRGEFIAALNHQPLPSLILLDMNMPDVDGYAVLSHLRRHDLLRNTLVVLVTACAVPEDVERAFKCGADGYLSKPVKVGVVRRLLTALLARH